MTTSIFTAATAALLLAGAGAAQAQTPVFETQGFPISWPQAQVTGLADIRERSPAATLMLGGMPASPHQLAVLTPRAAPTAMADALNQTAPTEVKLVLPQK
ncbi:hypothetical protein KXR53_04815 [Inquilinus limosus]|uniref:hypothetical protein n=1 Tax=Inquilinus limosus TaxID=171674 RepID=UPI003F18C72D